MYGLTVIEGISLSGHPSIINEITFPIETYTLGLVQDWLAQFIQISTKE